MYNNMRALRIWIGDATDAGISSSGEISVANGAPADGDTPARINAVSATAGLFNVAGEVASIYYQHTGMTLIGETDSGGNWYLTREGPTDLDQIQVGGGVNMAAYLSVDSFTVGLVPVPATAWFFVSGLAMLSACKRRSILDE